MSNKTSKERVKKLGTILVDFANAKTTDEAFIAYFRNIKTFLSFSPDFVERIKKVFPLKSSFYALLNQTEFKLLNLISEKERKIRSLESQIGYIGYILEDCNYKNNTLLLLQYVSCEGEPGYDYDGPFIVPIDDIKDKIQNTCHPDVLGHIEELMETDRQIHNKKNEVSIERFKELEALLKKHLEIIYLHEVIKETQKNFRDILENVTKGKRLRENFPFLYYFKQLREKDPFLDYFKHYNHANTKLAISDGDFLIEVPLITERKYLKTKEINWHVVIENDLRYCMIEFFKHEESKRYIHHCKNCKKYFVAKKIDKRIKYCPLCSPKSKMGKEERKEYQKKYRGKKRKEKIAHERGAKINNYMEKLSCTREEAEEIIEADSNL